MKHLKIWISSLLVAFILFPQLSLSALAHTIPSSTPSTEEIGNSNRPGLHTSVQPIRKDFLESHQEFISQASDFETHSSHNLEYVLDYNEEIGEHAVIMGYTGTESELTIPSFLDGYPVGGIGPWAFWQNETLVKVVIPEGVIIIGALSFSECPNLEEVIIPDTVQEIGVAVFQHSGKLKSITFPYGLTEIGEQMFYMCHSLESVSIPDTVQYIGPNAFSVCRALKSIHIPYGISKIEYDTFRMCKSLTNVTIPDTVTSIDRAAFSECDNLESIVIPDSVTSLGAQAFAVCNNLRSVSLSKNLVNTGNGTFMWCPSLTEVVIPEGITIVDDFAFFNCDNLEKVTLSETVESIGQEAFSDCDKLAEIVCPAGLKYLDDRAVASPNLSRLTFTGDAPEIHANAFQRITATAFYPEGNETWTKDVMQNYGGTITWIPYDDNPFTDVPKGSFYFDPVLWAVEHGITTGASETTFAPNDSCMRAHVVTFLWRAAGQPEPTSTVNPFEDVKESDFYYKAVLWAVENGITNGADAAHFNPFGICNRAQVVTFLHRAFGSPAVENAANPFTDVESGSWYAAPVLWAVENGITNGLSADSFGPNSPCNRAQVVTFLYRAYN